MQLSDLYDFIDFGTYSEVQKQIAEHYSKHIIKKLDKEFEDYDWDSGYWDAREINYDPEADRYSNDDIDVYIKEEMEKEYFMKNQYRFNEKTQSGYWVSTSINENEVSDIRDKLEDNFDFLDTDMITGIENMLWKTVKQWFEDNK